MGHVLGLSFLAIEISMDHFGVHLIDRRTTFERVRKLGLLYAKILNKRAEDDLTPEQKRRRASRGIQPPPMFSVQEMEENRLFLVQAERDLDPDATGG